MRRWILDEANRLVGQRVSHPVSEQEKVSKVHDLLADEQDAAQLAIDLLRQPTVVARVVEDSTAMHLVNRAQVDRSHRVAAERLQAGAAPDPLGDGTRPPERVRRNGAVPGAVSSVGRRGQQ